MRAASPHANRSAFSLTNYYAIDRSPRQQSYPYIDCILFIPEYSPAYNFYCLDRVLGQGHSMKPVITR